MKPLYKITSFIHQSGHFHLTCDGELLAGSLAGLSSRGAELFCFLKLGKRDWDFFFFFNSWRPHTLIQLPEIDVECRCRNTATTGKSNTQHGRRHMWGGNDGGLGTVFNRKRKKKKRLWNLGDSVHACFYLHPIPCSSSWFATAEQDRTVRV